MALRGACSSGGRELARRASVRWHSRTRRLKPDRLRNEMQEMSVVGFQNGDITDGLSMLLQLPHPLLRTETKNRVVRTVQSERLRKQTHGVVTARYCRGPTHSSQGWRGFASTPGGTFLKEDVHTNVGADAAASTERSTATGIAENNPETPDDIKQKGTNKKNSRGWRLRNGKPQGAGPGAGEFSGLSKAAIATGSLEECNRVLRILADRGDGTHAANLIGRMKQTGIAPSDRSYSSAINACGRGGGQWKLALALLREGSPRPKAVAPKKAAREPEEEKAGSSQVEGDATPGATSINRHHYAAAIKACAAGRQSKHVMSLLSEMEDFGLEPDVTCYNAMLRVIASGARGRDSSSHGSVSGKKRQPHGKKEALDLLDRMEKRGVAADEISYTHAISACKAEGDPGKALELLRRMAVPGGSGGDDGGENKEAIRNTFHYTTVVSAFAEHEDGWKQAVTLVKEMQAIGIAPNAYTYNAAITACGKAGRYAQAVALLRQMPAVGVTPDELTYASTIEACGNGKQWPLAVSLLREMATDASPADVNANVVCYTAAITACGNSGQWEQALALLREMTMTEDNEDNKVRDNAKKGLIVPDLIAYNAAISALAKCGQWRYALDLLLKEIPKAGLKPSAASFDPVVYACADAGEWQTAVSVLGDMERVGLKASSGCYFAVADACRGAEEGEVALEMKEKGVDVRRKMRNRRSWASDKKNSGAGGISASVVE